MRTSLFVLMITGLLLSAPLVLADGGRERSDKARHDAVDAEEDDANETHRGDKRAERAAFRMNQSALFENFTAHMRALKVSWHENATAVRDGCKGTDFDKQNATKEERKDVRHCIRDGYKAWRTAHAAELKDLREEFRAVTQGWGRAHHSS